MDPSEDVTVSPVYNSLFRRYIHSALRVALADLSADDFVLSEEQRQQVWHLLSFGLAAAESWPQVRDLLLALAPKMEQAGFRDEWLAYLEAGLGLARTQGDERGAAELNLQVGFLYVRLRQWDRAERCLTEARDGFAGLDDVVGRCAAMNRLAHIHRHRGDLVTAQALTAQTLSLLPDDSGEWAYSHFAAGLIYRELLDLSTARDHFEQAQAVSQRLGNRRQAALCILNLGLIHYAQGAFAESADRSLAAHALFLEINDLQNQAIAQMNAGMALTQIDRADESLALYAQAEANFHRLHDTVSLAMTRCNQGIAYRQLGQPAEAADAFQAGIDLWAQIGNLKRRINLVSGLGKAQMDLGHFDTAIATLTVGLAELEAVGPDAAVDNEYDRLTAVMRRDIVLARQGKLSPD